ncbi:MAG: adenylyl-sulfate kinase [Phycisphaerales bacterium]|nr:adenylyl-sulfate kinase [Phycisphaerales bacterium]
MTEQSPAPTTGTVPHEAIAFARRAELLGHRGLTVWLTGLPASGKSTIALALEESLLESRRAAVTLDGDTLRHALNAGLTFDAAGRAEAVRRAGEAALLIAQSGSIAIASLVSPYRSDRDLVRARHATLGIGFLEVFVDAPIEVVKARDPKGHYKMALKGELPAFTGVSDPYEPPLSPEVHLRTSDTTPAECVATLMSAIAARTAS